VKEILVQKHVSHQCPGFEQQGAEIGRQCKKRKDEITLQGKKFHHNQEDL